jgi:hypothetical protein
MINDMIIYSRPDRTYAARPLSQKVLQSRRVYQPGRDRFLTSTWSASVACHPDLTRNRSKRFCDNGCGNRAAVEAYRARKAAAKP